MLILWKKQLALFLSLLMLAIFLVGCEEEEEKKETQPAAAPAPAAPLLPYVRLDDTGKPLAIQDATFDSKGSYEKGSLWECVLVRETNQIWEVKTDVTAASDPRSLRNKDLKYTWYNATLTDTAAKGTAATDTTCKADLASTCDTEKYIAAQNAKELCGSKKWRLPTMADLSAIAQLEKRPTIDPYAFPNTSYDAYWLSDAFEKDKAAAKVFLLGQGVEGMSKKSIAQKVILVSDR